MGRRMPTSCTDRAVWGRRRRRSRSRASCSGTSAGSVARTHPDLVVVEALGEMIRIDRIRALHHDLHMRPFEGSRRVYVVLDAHLLNEDAADALLKDLEEPPGYATMVLVADELGPLPETIRSRCQLVPFRRLSDRAVREWMDGQSAGVDPEQADGAGPRRGGAARPSASPARSRCARASRRAPRGRAVGVPRTKSSTSRPPLLWCSRRPRPREPRRGMSKRRPWPGSTSRSVSASSA